MVQVAQELVEAVVGRQMLVQVTQVILAVLRRHVALAFQQAGNRGVGLHQAFLGARQAHLEQAGADGRLARQEGGAAGGAALLAVPVGEQRTLSGDPVDVGGLVAHDAQVVGAGVVPADVVAPDHEDVGLVGGESRRRGGMDSIANRVNQEN